MMVSMVIFIRTPFYRRDSPKAGDYAEDMAMEMLATTMGLPNDDSLHGMKNRNNGDFLEKYTRHKLTQSAEGHKDGMWTTVLSAAVLLI